MKQLFLKNFRNSLLSIITVLAIVFSIPALSAQVTQAQIEQFKKLSPAQQKSLANAMGFNLPNSDQTLPTSEQQEQVTEFTSKQSDKEINEVEMEDVFLNLGSQTKLKAFGYDIFSNAPSTFNPVSNIAIPESYIIGIGDQITLQIFGKENNQFLLDVTREGQVIIPNLGPFQVAGLSFNEMKRYLVSQIKERIIGVDAVLSLSQLKSIRVFVLGDAYKPGPYNISSLSSITHALFSAGGVSEIGSLRNIQLKRSGKLIQTFDMYDLLIKGDSSKDVLLQSGDVVFVETKGKTVSVAGKVRRPAIYELSDTENITNVLSMAGGLLPDAYKESVVIERFDDASRTVLNVDLTNPKEAKEQIYNGDYISVMEKSQNYSDAITVVGAVTRPGKYQWKQGIRVSDVITSLDSSLLSYADLTYSLIVREINMAKHIEVHHFSLSNAIKNKDSKDNILLTERDKIIVFSSVEKISNDLQTLDELALTEKDLFNEEKQKAKEKYAEIEFWKKYDGKSQYLNFELENESKEEQLSSSENFEFDLLSDSDNSQQAVFSRERLLKTINQQLIRQGAAGKPVMLVDVDGQVKFPGTYPLTVNARLSDVIIAAGGITESAFLSKADLTRNDVSQLMAKKENIQVNLAEALNNPISEDNLLIQSKDRIHIHQIPAWSKNHVVELKGEFVFPGKYTIQRGETLSDIINRAGGFTEYANLDGSLFTRVKLKQLERNNMIKLADNLKVELASKALSESSSLAYSQTQTLLNDLNKLEPVGRLVVDIKKILYSNDYDVLLESGDVLHIPSKKNSVNVIGQVQVTSSHIFEKNLTVEDYIANSGGVKKRADLERVYIIAANGSIKKVETNSWFSASGSYQIAPGDTVVVPLDSDYSSNITLWTVATDIIYKSAVALAAVNGL